MKNVVESNPPNSRFSVRGLAAQANLQLLQTTQSQGAVFSSGASGAAHVFFESGEFIYSACRIARRLHRRRVGPRAVYSAPKSIYRVLSVGAVQVKVANTEANYSDP